MRIAIVNERWEGGAARCTRDLMRELGKHNEVLYFPRDNEETMTSILRELDGYRPNIVHCHSFYGGLPYEFLPLVSKRYSTCFTVHDPRPIGTIAPICWNCEQNATCRYCPMVSSGWRQLLRNDYYRARKAKRRAHDQCAATLQVVAPSRWLLERLGTQELGRFRRHHIPNGVDSKHFKFVPSARAEFGLPERQPVVLFLAWNPTHDLDPRKGLRTVAAAFERHVFPAAPDTILAVAGEAYAPNHPNVRPLGRISRERLPRLYSTVNMYVTATVADNLPYAILEAMACGLPVVATNVGGIPELVTDGESGLLVPPADPDVLGAAILHLLRDPDLASRMGKEGRGRVEREFTMAKFVSAYERLFEEMSKPHAMN